MLISIDKQSGGICGVSPEKEKEGYTMGRICRLFTKQS